MMKKSPKYPEKKPYTSFFQNKISPVTERKQKKLKIEELEFLLIEMKIEIIFLAIHFLEMIYLIKINNKEKTYDMKMAMKIIIIYKLNLLILIEKKMRKRMIQG